MNGFIRNDLFKAKYCRWILQENIVERKLGVDLEMRLQMPTLTGKDSAHMGLL